MAGQFKLKKQIYEIFNEALLYTSPPKQHIQELIPLLQSNDEVFTGTLLTILSQFLQGYKKSQKAGRGMNFIVALFKEFRQIVCHFESEFCSQVAKNVVFEVFLFLCEGVKTSNAVKREASAWMLEKIIAMNIHQLMDFPQELYEEIYDVLPLLAKDKKNKIRNYAISIAAGVNKAEEFLKFIVMDPAVENRKTAVANSNDIENFQDISASLNDIEAEVRIAAYEKVLTWGMSFLSPEHKQEIFFASFFDRNSKLKNLATEIILQEINSNSLLTLLNTLEITTLNPLKQKKLKKSLQNFLKSQPASDLESLFDKSIKQIFDSTASPSVFILCTSILKSINPSDFSTAFNKLDPDYIISLIPSTGTNFPYFHCQTLINISMYLDLGAEEIRQKLLLALFQVCKNFPYSLKSQDLSRDYFISYNKNAFAEDLADLCIYTSKCIKKLVDSNPNEYLRIMTEVVNEIREPLIIEGETELTFIENTQKPIGLLEKKLGYKAKIEDMEAELEELSSLKAMLIEKNKYQEALKIHYELEMKEKDLEAYAKKIVELDEDLNKVLTRALILTTEMLANTKYGCMHNDIPDLVHNLVQPGLDSRVSTIIKLATECLAQCCLHNLDLFSEYNEFFNCILKENNTDVHIQKTVIVFYCDMMLVKDPKILHKSLANKEQKEKHSILWNISHYSYDENEFLRAFAVEGICKIFMSGKIKSSSLLAILMVPYFDKTSPDIIKQSLQIFFPNFVVLTEKNPKIVCKAFKTFVFFLFCLSTCQDFLDIQFLFNVKKIFSFICLSLSPEFIKRHGNFESNYNFSLEIFYHICQTIIKITTFEGKNDGKVQLRPELLIRLLPLINISRFNDKELYICRSMMKKINIEETLMEYKIMKKITDGIDKKNIGYMIVEDLESSLIDRFLKSETSASKFFSHLNSQNPEIISAFSHIKSVFSLYSSLKRSPTSRICSELKRSKNI